MMTSEGFLVVDKPEGPTSFDVVAIIRKLTGVKKVGHAGTLDPMATGILVVAIGRNATRSIEKYMKTDKTYEATIEFGKTSDTYDRLGKINIVSVKNRLSREEIEDALKSFRGEILQMPPAYSAKKIDGERAYKLARAGLEVKLEPKKVSIKELDILEYSWPILKIRTKVSSGTYIRSIAHDLGQVLKTGAILTTLRRTTQSSFVISDATALDDLSPNVIQQKLIQI